MTNNGEQPMADVMGDEIERELEKQLALQTDPNNPTDEFVAIFKELVDREADLAAAECGRKPGSVVTGDARQGAIAFLQREFDAC